MRFLLISNSLDSLVNFRLDLIKAVWKAGYEVHVVFSKSPDSDLSKCEILAAHGVVIHSVPMSRAGLNPLVDLLTLCCLVKVMWLVRPSMILTYTIKPVIWGTLAGFLTRIPRRFALITGLGYAFVEGSEVSKKRKFVRSVVISLYSLALNRCARVFFQNPDDERLFRSLKIIKPAVQSTVVKGSGVNLEHFQRQPFPEKPVFLMIARLLVDKGVRQYASAARLMKLKYPDAEFHLVGYLDENPESIAQDELDQWVSLGFIRYLGKLSDVRSAIAEASVFVLPTFYREGIPRTILEALAMGRPIVTTDMPGCRETVRENVNGFLVKPKSVEELSAVMERFICEPELISRMGEASYKLACADFDVSKVNRQMLIGMGFYNEKIV